MATSTLTKAIIDQKKKLDENYQEERTENIKKLMDIKNTHIKEMLQGIYDESDSDLRRCLDLAKEKGSSIWLNTLPIKALGHALNKQEFIDSIALRYNFPVEGMATLCACGKKNDIDHALTCMRGGYTIMRHNVVRDLEARLLKDVCRDVQTEPPLIPLSGQQFSKSANHQDGARLDVSARDFWTPMERAFLDIRIFHPNAPTNKSKSLKRLYETHEAEKKAVYEERVIHVEHGTFTPLVFSTSGGYGPACTSFHKRLALLLSDKRNDTYADAMSYVRRSLRFCILKATLIAIRGFRGYKEKNVGMLALSEVDFSVTQFNNKVKDSH